jgi:hypothetical protein
MFSRLIYDHSAELFTVAAFIVAASIFLTVSWRAIRMRRPQVEQFAQLPFAIATPAARAEPKNQDRHS